MRRAQSGTAKSLKEKLALAKINFAKATKEYEGVKAKLYAVISGESTLPEDILTEMASEAPKRMLDASERMSHLQGELAEESRREDGVRKERQDILKWSELFESSDMAVKKIVVSYLIKRIHVYSDYQLRVEFNIDLDQFELGLEIPNQYEQKTTSA